MNSTGHEESARRSRPVGTVPYCGSGEDSLGTGATQISRNRPNTVPWHFTDILIGSAGYDPSAARKPEKPKNSEVRGKLLHRPELQPIASPNDLVGPHIHTRIFICS